MTGRWKVLEARMATDFYRPGVERERALSGSVVVLCSMSHVGGLSILDDSASSCHCQCFFDTRHNRRLWRSETTPAATMNTQSAIYGLKCQVRHSQSHMFCL